MGVGTPVQGLDRNPTQCQVAGRHASGNSSTLAQRRGCSREHKVASTFLQPTSPVDCHSPADRDRPMTRLLRRLPCPPSRPHHRMCREHYPPKTALLPGEPLELALGGVPFTATSTYDNEFWNKPRAPRPVEPLTYTHRPGPMITVCGWVGGGAEGWVGGRVGGRAEGQEAHYREHRWEHSKEAALTGGASFTHF